MSTKKSHGKIRKSPIVEPEEHEIKAIIVSGIKSPNTKIYLEHDARKLVVDGHLEEAWFSETQCYCGGNLMNELIEADGTFTFKPEGTAPVEGVKIQARQEDEKLYSHEEAMRLVREGHLRKAWYSETAFIARHDDMVELAESKKATKH